jgi:hypothetical protein
MNDFIYQPGRRGDAERAAALEVPSTPTFADEPLPTSIRDVTAEDFEVRWDADRTFPFFEDDYGSGVYGYGHQDRAAFAAAVNAFDVYAGSVSLDEANYEAGDVHHVWAIAYDPFPDAHDDDWRFRTGGITADTPRAFPMTWVSR